MIQRQSVISLAVLAVAAVLGGCGGSDSSNVVTPPPAATLPQVTRVDTLYSSEQAFHGITFRGSEAYLSLGNTKTVGTAVMKAALPLGANSNWNPVALGACAIGKATEYMPARAPGLRKLGNTLWLFQPWYDGPDKTGEEHALCALNDQGTAFEPRDAGLRACNEYGCSTLWMTDLKMINNRLYTNAGAGLNLFDSGNNGVNWRVLLGGFDSMICTHSTFTVVGDRVLVGGECPLDDAFIRAYQLAPNGAGLVSNNELPITLPEMENRNVHFIEPVGSTNLVFAGVEGALLKSDDAGKSFKFVIHHPIEGQTYPYITHFLASKAQPNVIIVGGFDKATTKPFLAWSNDGGNKWTDISSLLPGYNRSPAEGHTAIVTGIAEDPQGRLLITMNEEEFGKGRLMQLTLGKP